MHELYSFAEVRLANMSIKGALNPSGAVVSLELSLVKL